MFLAILFLVTSREAPVQGIPEVLVRMVNVTFRCPVVMGHVLTKFGGLLHFGGEETGKGIFGYLVPKGIDDGVPSVAEGGHFTVAQPGESRQVDQCEDEVVLSVGFEESIDHV